MADTTSVTNLTAAGILSVLTDGSDEAKQGLADLLCHYLQGCIDPRFTLSTSFLDAINSYLSTNSVEITDPFGVPLGLSLPMHA